MSQYPIIAEHVLRPVSGGFLRSARRDLSELPARPPGSELIAVVDHNPELLPSHLRGSERVFVEASSIIVVDTRPYQQVTVELELESSTVGELFIVRAVFSCTVSDALIAAKRAPRDIAPVLETHLKSDARLMGAGKTHAIGDVTKLRKYVTARVTTLCSARKPPAEGVSVQFASVDIETPQTLIDHAKAARERRQQLELEQLQQQLDREKHQFTLEQAELIERVIARGPEAIQALALRLNERRYEEVSERAYGDRQRREDRLLELTMRMADHGHFDTVAIETKRLIDQVIDSLAGPSGRDATAIASGGEPVPQLSPSEDDDADADGDRPSDPPDEESLVG